MLSANGITVRYGAATVLENVSLRVESGMWLMLCGPNGAGKSTLAGALAQTVPYKGTVLLYGKNARSYSASAFARHVGMLAQKNDVSYDFTVEEVVSLGRYAHRRGLFTSGEDDTRHVEQALSDTGLLPLRDHSVSTLSGGERQRAFLAQVLCQDPRLLILDEPANHLDLGYQEKLFTLIGEWLKAPGRAVISVVHDLSLARRFGTHALLLDRGHVRAEGDIKTVLTRDRLREVYNMDVHAWMQTLLRQWED